MKIVACVEDRYGLLFNRRRVSQDAAVAEKIASLCGNEILWADPYSAPLFPSEINVHTDDSFLDKAEAEDWCFLENRDIRPCMPRVKELMLFRWNRKYPYDFAFPFEECFGSWKLISRDDFPGNSHDNITMEVYRP